MREGIAITPEVKEHLWTALTSLASAPVEERTITGLAVLLQSNDLKQALRPFCVGGAYGRLLDAETEHLGSADVQAFEIEGLVGTGAAPAVLSYLFHSIGDRLDGRPTLLIIDEGWLALDDEGFAGQLREWLKTLRKKNASVIFATQSLSDIDGSNIAPAIIESCPTRLLLPNERAIEPQITAIYRRFGLNDRMTGRSKSLHGPRPSGIITAKAAGAIACSSLACPKSALRSAPHPRNPIRPKSRASMPNTEATASSPAGCASAVSSGRPT
nr:hypothetical protein [Acinetobacter baumannii]